MKWLSHLLAGATLTLSMIGCAAQSDDSSEGAPVSDGEDGVLASEEDGEVAQTSQALSCGGENCSSLDWHDVARGKYSGKRMCCKVGFQFHGLAEGYCSRYLGQDLDGALSLDAVVTKWEIKKCGGFGCTNVGRRIQARHCH